MSDEIVCLENNICAKVTGEVVNFSGPLNKKALEILLQNNCWISKQITIGQLVSSLTKYKAKIRTKPDGHIFAKELFDKDLNKREYMGDRVLCLLTWQSRMARNPPNLRDLMQES